MALAEAGYETIMVNCNPETVSTDYDTSDRLYFEPLTLEDVLEIVHAEQQAGPMAGVVCQLGGQTPLGLAQGLADAGVPIVGTTPEAIHLAEERGAFGRVLADAGLPAPKHGTATSYPQAQRIAHEIGYPVLVRPSYVLGGRGMEIVYDDAALEAYLEKYVANGLINERQPVLVDRFLDDAVEIDVDAIFDGEELFLGGVMEHIEEAGIHSGDSSCALPPITLGREEIDRIRSSTEAIARGLDVRGLLNIQFALASDVLYVLEANPRASRTVPFVSKATATPLAKAAARVMLGESIADLRVAGVLPAEGDGGHLPDGSPIAVKEAVMPFDRFKTSDGRTVDALLGPEMRSTGEVMGFDAFFGTAFAKAQAAAYGSLPLSGRVFVSVANRDKRHMIFPVKQIADMGFEILATAGTAEVLRRNGVAVHGRPQAVRGRGPGRRADDRRSDPRPRGRPGHQHAPRSHERRLAARRRLRHPHGRRAHRHPVHHHHPGTRRRRAGARGDAPRRHRRPLAAGLGGAREQRWGRLTVRPYDVLFEQALTRVDPERIHHAAFRAIRAAAPVTTRALRVPSAPVHALGLTFPHPLGLAAGLRQERRRDRRARRPRLRARRDRHRHRRGPARQPAAAAVPAARRPGDRQPDGLQQRRCRGGRPGRLAALARGRPVAPILGVNIGKTKVVPEDEAIGDYEKSAGLLAPFADYLVVNVSSPNTPGLRDLQAVEKLEPLLTAVRRRADEVRPDRPGAAAGQDRPRPQRRRRARRGRPRARHRARRHHRHQHDHQPRRASPRRRPRVEGIGAGGLSGRPLTQRSEDVYALLRERVGPDLTLVGVGGITTVDDARRRLDGRRRPPAGLHRLRLRGPAVAAAHRAGLATDGYERGPADSSVARACTSTARWSRPSGSAATAT